MFNLLDLKIYLPTEIFLDKSIKKLTFKGKEGYLCRQGQSAQKRKL